MLCSVHWQIRRKKMVTFHIEIQNWQEYCRWVRNKPESSSIMFLANTRQNEKLNFTLDFKHFFLFGEVCRAIWKKISPKKKRCQCTGRNFRLCHSQSSTRRASVNFSADCSWFARQLRRMGGIVRKLIFHRPFFSAVCQLKVKAFSLAVNNTLQFVIFLWVNLSFF